MNEIGLGSSEGTNQIDKGERSKKSNIKNGRWTQEEHNRFLQSLRLFGKD